MRRNKTIVVFTIFIIALGSTSYSQIWSPPMRVTPPGYTGFPGLITAWGKIWCYWGNHMAYYDEAKGMWSYPMETPGQGHFTTDKYGNLWLIGTSQAWVYDGSKWSPPMSVPPRVGHSWFAAATGDSAGGIWVSWDTDYYGWFNVVVAHYDGKEWGQPVRLSREIEGNNFSGGITTDKNGRVWLNWCSYYRIDELHFQGVVYTVFNDGSGWSDTIPILRKRAGGGMVVPETSGGLWAVWYAEDSTDGYHIFVGHYDGKTWSIQDPLGFGLPPYPWPVLTVDHKNRVWVVWNCGDDGTPWFTCYDGENWSKPALITEDFRVDPYVNLGVDGAGRIWAVWPTLYGGEGDIIYASYTYGLGIGEETDKSRPTPDIELHENFPNPFRAATQLSYSIAEPGYVRLSVCNVTGQLIRNLVNKSQLPGCYKTVWDGRDNFGMIVASGIYFCRLEVKNWTKTRPMVLLR